MTDDEFEQFLDDIQILLDDMPRRQVIENPWRGEYEKRDNILYVEF